MNMENENMEKRKKDKRTEMIEKLLEALTSIPGSREYKL